MRTFERLLRRCDLPFHRSQGFHPKPRLVFALSLPLGVIGCQEVVELELDRLLPPEEVHDRLARQTPPGLEILSVRRIPLKSTAQVCRLCYAVPVPEARRPELQQRIRDVLAGTACWIDRGRPHARQPGRRLDVRPFLADLRIRTIPGAHAPRGHDAGDALRHVTDSLPDGTQSVPTTVPTQSVGTSTAPSPVLEMDLHLTPAGTARPDEILALLGLHDLLDAGAVLSRTRLELYDELPPCSEGSAIEPEKVAHEKRDAN
jgi:radical SAM-linked protein